MAKTYSVITYGCQMNKADSERIAAVLERLGYRKSTKKDSNPDLAVVNACSVRQAAVDRVYGQAEKLKKLKVAKTIITGCLLPKDRQRLARKFDLVFNIKDLGKLPVLLGGRPKEKFFGVEPRRQSRFSALVPISSGCRRFCTYCAVPYTRGLENNRSARDILREIKGLLRDGYQEITLLGQTVSSWQDPQRPGYKFVDLLAEVESFPGKFWLRFASPYVLDFDDRLIDFLSRSEKTCPCLNLPLQSGDNLILKRMNRCYTVGQYLKVWEKMKKRIPDFSFSTDIIVGFCGETEKQFWNTRKVFERIRPAMAYIAQYSSRPGTGASKMADSVSLKTKKARLKELTRLLRITARENHQKEVGRTLEVLVDSWRPDKKECLGKTRNFKTVRFKSQKNLVGVFVPVRVVRAREFELEGELVSSRAGSSLLRPGGRAVRRERKPL